MVLSGRKEESIRHLDKRALELGLNLANIEGRGAQLQGQKSAGNEQCRGSTQEGE